MLYRAKEAINRQKIKADIQNSGILNSEIISNNNSNLRTIGYAYCLTEYLKKKKIVFKAPSIFEIIPKAHEFIYKNKWEIFSNDSDYSESEIISASIVIDIMESPESIIGVNNFVEYFKKEPRVGGYIMALLVRFGVPFFEGMGTLFGDWEMCVERISEDYNDLSDEQKKNFDTYKKILKSKPYKAVFNPKMDNIRPKSKNKKFNKLMDFTEKATRKHIDIFMVSYQYFPDGYIPPTEFFNFGLEHAEEGSFYPGGYEFIQNSFTISEEVILEDTEPRAIVYSPEEVLELKNQIRRFNTLWNYLWQQMK